MRRRRGRSAVQPDQLVLPVRAEALRDLVADGLGRHRRRGVLQPGQLLAVGAGDLLGQRRLEHAQRLPELHRPALELARGSGTAARRSAAGSRSAPSRPTPRPAACRARSRCARRTPAAGPPVAPCARRPCGAGPGPAWRHSPRPSMGRRRGRRRRLPSGRRYRQVPVPLDRRRDPRTHCPDAHSDRCGGTTGELGAIGPGPQSCARRVRPWRGRHMSSIYDDLTLDRPRPTWTPRPPSSGADRRGAGPGPGHGRGGAPPGARCAERRRAVGGGERGGRADQGARAGPTATSCWRSPGRGGPGCWQEARDEAEQVKAVAGAEADQILAEAGTRPSR